MDKLECIATNGQTVIRLKHKPSGQPKRGMEGYHFEQEHLIYGFWGKIQHVQPIAIFGVPLILEIV